MSLKQNLNFTNNVGILLAVQFMETESLNFASNGGYTKHKITIKFFSFLHETFIYVFRCRDSGVIFFNWLLE